MAKLVKDIAADLGISEKKLREALQKTDITLGDKVMFINDQKAADIFKGVQKVLVQEKNQIIEEKEKEAQKAKDQKKATTKKKPVAAEHKTTTRPKTTPQKKTTDDKIKKTLANMEFDTKSYSSTPASKTTSPAVKTFKKEQPADFSKKKKELTEDSLEEKRLQKIKKHRKNNTTPKEPVVETSGTSKRKKRVIVEIPEVLGIKELSVATQLPVGQILTELIKNGINSNINDSIDFDTAALVLDDLNITVKKKEDESLTLDNQELVLKNMLAEDNPKKSKNRPPIVVVMGHVDHGKTTLLDYIRKTKVTAQESGGITQEIGAYKVKKDKKEITFLDTPGHEAFTAMRARGSKVTDIAILVVAANDGVKDTTREAINHAREAGLDIIVAINKIDLPEANLEKVKGELAEEGLISEDRGGTIITMPVSAKSGEWVDELLDMVLLTAQVKDLKADFKRTAVATVIESKLDNKLWPVASVIINTGTLKKGNIVSVGPSYGKIRSIINEHKKQINSSWPSDPVLITGLSSVPATGDILLVMDTEKIARERSLKILTLRNNKIAQSRKMTAAEISESIAKGERDQLKIILKTDVKWSLEAVKSSLLKIESKLAEIKIIHNGVGQITESDITMAKASNGIIIGFNTKMTLQVTKLALKEGVLVNNYDIIYTLLADVKEILFGLVKPEKKLVNIGKLLVKGLFWHKKTSSIIGGEVIEGYIKNRLNIEIFRNDEQIGKGSVEKMQLINKEVNQVETGAECGITIKSGTKINIDDVIYFYEELEEELEN